MSWSVSAIGKPRAVAGKIAMQFASIKCAEPEETIKASVEIAMKTALAAFPETMPVKASASGSQSTDSKTPGVAINNLSVSIEPIYGFCE